MKSINHRVDRGFSLLEVMIAVVVLAIGLMSLAALQGRLFQAGAESKARTTASALAQQAIEDARAYPFAKAPTGFTGPDYVGLVSWDTDQKVTEGGVEFTVSREVSRYRPDGTELAVGALFDPSKPEFKVVNVSVSWAGADGTSKSIQLKDSMASLAPADAFNVIKTPVAAESGPQVWIEPPNKDNPAVVPIAVGDDQSAASSNPVPRRFTKQDSNTAATIFSVHTFSGSANGSEVLLNRKLDVAAVTCRCSGTSASTASNPAYEPVVWNGKQLAYMDPRPLPAGTKIGTYSGGQSSKDIDEMCTVCCRDHHESTERLQRPDPYRKLPNELYAGEAYGSEHYLVSPKSQNEPDLPMFVGPRSSGEYSEACQIIRVDGRSRLAIDPMQNMLVTVPMTDDLKSQEVRDEDGNVLEGKFAEMYSGMVVDFISGGVGTVKSQPGYLSPDSRFPEFVEASYSPFYDPILKPAPVLLPTKTGAQTKSLVSFGLYVDYLSPETIAAYDCAANKATNSSDASCDGLRDRNPLETLPFYAINVANLGVWNPEMVDSHPYWVSSPEYEKNTGILKGNGGVVAMQSGNEEVCTEVSIAITRSSSGIAARLPIDKDDSAGTNRSGDSLKFTEDPLVLDETDCEPT